MSKTKYQIAVETIRKCCIEARDEYLECKTMCEKYGDEYWGKAVEKTLQTKMNYEEMYQKVTGKEMEY